MKYLFSLAILIIISSSCHSQKMVQKTTDAKKLEQNKEQFIGKPLRELLAQIKPQIKFVYGNPENAWAGQTGGTYLKFHFVDLNEIKEKDAKNKKVTGIIVNFELMPSNKHKALPKGGLKEWTNKETKEYGDMIILKVRVIEES